jgi:hypothetical protein
LLYNAKHEVVMEKKTVVALMAAVILSGKTYGHEEAQRKGKTAHEVAAEEALALYNAVESTTK